MCLDFAKLAVKFTLLEKPGLTGTRNGATFYLKQNFIPGLFSVTLFVRIG
jgi:hypothetical protein